MVESGIIGPYRVETKCFYGLCEDRAARVVFSLENQRTRGSIGIIPKWPSLSCGTGSSNPACSGVESGANLTFCDFRRIADDIGKAAVGGRDLDQRLGEFLDFIGVGCARGLPRYLF